jgi:hypothetical protein
MKLGSALRKRYGHLHAGEKKFCPAGSQMQTILFPTAAFTVADAKKWAKKEHFKTSDVDVKENFIHLRQMDPSLFKRLRNIPLGEKGIEGVVGWRKC